MPDDRGHHLSADWRPEPASIDLARELGLDPDDVLAEFRDYWMDIPGARGRKLNWNGTFRNRCRELAKRQLRPQQAALPLLAAVTSAPARRNPRPGSPDIVIEASTGRPMVNGWYLDDTFTELLAIAGIDEVNSMATWLDVVRWLRDGRRPADLEVTIRYCASRPGYRVPAFLAAFNRPVAEGWGLAERRA